MPAFHATLLTRLDSENFTIPHPDHVFFLQDDDGDPYDVPAAAIPPDAAYGDMWQPPKLASESQCRSKLNADHNEFATSET